MRVMIVGQKWLGAETLALCTRRGYEVAGVAAPSPQDRLALAGVEAGVPVVVAPLRLEPDLVPAGVDLLVCAHAHAFIPAATRLKTKLGAIGYHPSLLPRHRGRDAVRWAVHMGDRVTGGTVYWLDDKADGGAIAAQEWCWVRPEDTTDALWRRELGPMGLRLIEKVLADVNEGSVAAVPQDELLATWEPSWDRPNMKALC